MTRRTATFALALFDAAACGIVIWASITSTSDPATIGFDQAAGALVALLFMMTGAPALALNYLGKAPRTALLLAMAFPAVFALLFAGAAIYFSAVFI
jgi:hypothetical protein